MIFFLYGEDSFRSLQKITEIKKKFFLNDPVGTGLSVFDWDQKDNSEKFLDILGMPNLLAPKRLVIVRRMMEFAVDTEKEEIITYFKKNEQWLVDNQDLVIVFWENGQPKKNGKIYKLLNKIGKTQNFEKLSGLKLNKWIVDRVSLGGVGLKISLKALNRLILFVGNELGLLDNELQKLINFVDNGTIEEADIDLLVKANIDVNIFSTMDALANRNKKEALYLLHEHLKNGEDAFYVFSMIVYQFRNLIKVAGSMDKFHNDEYALGKEIGLHPYVVKKSLQQLRNFPLVKLKKIYEQLSQLDLQVKTGKLDIKLALDMFIVEL